MCAVEGLVIGVLSGQWTHRVLKLEEESPESWSTVAWVNGRDFSSSSLLTSKTTRWDYPYLRGHWDTHWWPSIGPNWPNHSENMSTGSTHRHPSPNTGGKKVSLRPYAVSGERDGEGRTMKEGRNPSERELGLRMDGVFSPKETGFNWNRLFYFRRDWVYIHNTIHYPLLSPTAGSRGALGQAEITYREKIKLSFLRVWVVVCKFQLHYTNNSKNKMEREGIMGNRSWHS